MIKIFTLFLLLTLSLAFKRPVPITKSNLSKKKIHKFKVDNNEIVLWWDNKKWCCTGSVCKHRLGDLSNGLITPQGQLKCGYHGWEYSSCGNCTYVPSSLIQPKLKIPDYKVKEKYGLIWLYSNESKDFIPELSETNIRSPWFLDNVNVPKKYLMENAFDSLHFDHVHSGTPPPIDRYNPQQRYNNPTSYLNWYNETGFSCNVNTIEYKFLAPSTIIIDFSKDFSIYAEAISIDDENTRFISTSFTKSQNKLVFNIMKFSFIILSPITNWLGWKIWDQDVEQVTGQYNNVKKYGYQHMKLSCADDPITYFNHWLNEYA